MMMAANAIHTAEQRTMEELFGERDEAASLLVECLKTLDRAMGAYRVVNQSAYKKWSAYIHHEVAVADELDPSKVVPFKAFQWPLKVDSMETRRGSNVTWTTRPTTPASYRRHQK